MQAPIQFIGDFLNRAIPNDNEHGDAVPAGAYIMADAGGVHRAFLPIGAEGHFQKYQGMFLPKILDRVFRFIHIVFRTLFRF
jgi:hypothetical protein